jgi:Fe-S-cluster containining protein
MSLPVLAPEVASRVCMHECGARCCRGPQYLRLGVDEVPAFAARAAGLGVQVHLEPAPGGGALVRYLEHDGERCPMLDAATWACRIYAHRPRRCREFPDGPRPGCAISGVVVEPG